MTPAERAQLPITLADTAAPVRMWLPQEEADDAALAQLRNIADLPWVHGVRAMPDCHLGIGATVGSVITMRGAVSPAAVGVDIGCGVAAVRTDLVEEDLEDLGTLRSAIEAAIPVGFAAHEEALSASELSRLGARAGLEQFWEGFSALPEAVQKREEKARKQLGTMGGGNHFAELCVDSRDGRVWITLHSGSRNVGKEVAEVHIFRAKGLEHNAQLHDKNLAVFLADSSGMADYVRDVHRARGVRLPLPRDHDRPVPARRHGALGRSRARGALRHARELPPQLPLDRADRRGAHGGHPQGRDLHPRRRPRAHPRFDGRGLVHRAGRRTPTFYSASHGAGRKMSRNAARKAFTVADLAQQTKGIETRKDAGVLDEIPSAYKDLHAVMTYQSDLVEPVAHLQTVLCVKG